MTTTYVGTQFFKRGVKRSNGKGMTCIQTGCGKTATVTTKRKRKGSAMVLPLALCESHWEETNA